MASRKWLVLIVVILVIAAGTYWIMHSSQASANISDGKDVIPVQRVDFPLIVDATGSLEAIRSVDVSPPQVGRERRFKLTRLVEEGTQVTEGDF